METSYKHTCAYCKKEFDTSMKEITLLNRKVNVVDSITCSKDCNKQLKLIINKWDKLNR